MLKLLYLWLRVSLSVTWESFCFSGRAVKHLFEFCLVAVFAEEGNVECSNFYIFGCVSACPLFGRALEVLLQSEAYSTAAVGVAIGVVSCSVLDLHMPTQSGCRFASAVLAWLLAPCDARVAWLMFFHFIRKA